MMNTIIPATLKTMVGFFFGGGEENGEEGEEEKGRGGTRFLLDFGRETWVSSLQPVYSSPTDRVPPLMSSRGREEQDSTGGCKLVEILQHTCPFEEVNGVHRYVCYPIPRIFKLCVGCRMGLTIPVLTSWQYQM